VCQRVVSDDVLYTIIIVFFITLNAYNSNIMIMHRCLGGRMVNSDRGEIRHSYPEYASTRGAEDACMSNNNNNNNNCKFCKIIQFFMYYVVSISLQNACLSREGELGA